MVDVPSNLIPRRITGLTEYQGSSLEGYIPYVLGGVTYKLQLSTVIDTTTGTVTSVGLSGGSTGFSFSDSPITSAGTMVMGGTLNLASGGTGASLADPGGDRVLFWDDSAGAITWLTMGSNLTITGTTLDATGGSLDTLTDVTITGVADKELLAYDNGSSKWINQTAAEAGLLTTSAIGTTVQAYDADLTTWAGVTPGTGVATALAVNVGSAGAFIVNGGALGTPSGGVATNITGLPLSTGVTGQLPLANGGTGANLTDPNADRILFWDDSGGAMTWLTVGSNLSITGTTLDATGGGSVEGTAVLSTGEVGGTKFLREDGDGTCSWQSVPGGGDALTTNPLSQFAATTSLQLKGVMSDETGSGALVFADTPTLTTPVLGTPSSGTLTNCTGLPIAGLVSSTSTALGVGSLNVGHASDTTLSRVSAGVMAVEGVNIVTVSSTDTLTNKTLTAPTINDASVTEPFRRPIFTITDGASVSIDPANGAVQKWTLGASRTAAAPATWDEGQEIILLINDGAAYTLNLSAVTTTWRTNGGVAPTLNTTGWTEISLVKQDGVIVGARIGNA